jgi:hypothetical protein
LKESQEEKKIMLLDPEIKDGMSENFTPRNVLKPICSEYYCCQMLENCLCRKDSTRTQHCIFW